MLSGNNKIEKRNHNDAAHILRVYTYKSAWKTRGNNGQ